MSKLIVLTGPQANAAYELKGERTTVGRIEDNTLQLSEPSVSSHHCELFQKGNEVVVRDLNSTNGTFINGERVTEGVLKPGQVLRLGQIDLRLENGAGKPMKQSLEQTRVITGVKAKDFDPGGRPVTFEKSSPFAKKSNKTAVIFITIAVVLAVIIVIGFFIAFHKAQSPGY